MSEPTYRDALRASWKLAKQHHNLWPLGLFALFLGQFGFLEIITKVWAVRSGRFFQAWQTGEQVFSLRSWHELQAIFSQSTAHWVWAVWLFISLLGLSLGLIFVATVCQGALVWVGAKYSRLRVRFPSEATAWHVGVTHFWRVLGFNAIRKYIVWVSAFALAELALHQGAGSTLLFWVSLIGALILGMIVSIVTMYAVGYTVVEEYGFAQSLNAATRLFLKHPLVSLEVGIITLLINIGVLVGTLLSLLYLFFLPNLLLKYLSYWVAVPHLGQIVGLVSLALFLAVSLAIGAMFAVFSISVWSYLFSRMHQGKVVSKVLRLIRN